MPNKIRKATLSVTSMVQSGQTQWTMSLEDATVTDIKEVFAYTFDRIEESDSDEHDYHGEVLQ